MAESRPLDELVNESAVRYSVSDSTEIVYLSVPPHQHETCLLHRS